MIVVLVEGTGDKRSLPTLVQRCALDTQIRPVDMNGKSNIVRKERGFEDTVRRQYALGGRAFIVLVDGDVTSAPYRSLEEERRDLRRRAQFLARELAVPVQVCWAIIEIESWLIGGIQPGSSYCGLRQIGKAPSNTESKPPDPKKWLKTHLVNREYNPRIQRCLAGKIDVQEAKRRNNSMRIFLNMCDVR